MFLTRYDFTGPRDTLLDGLHRMVGAFGDDVMFSVVVVTDTGVALLDACPDRATMEHFSTSTEFMGALDAHDLPRPVITPLGDLHLVLARNGLTQTPVHA